MVDPERLRLELRASRAGEPRLFRAPGRVNLIGEHTDYNDGFVLPAAIDRQIVVAAMPREDRRIRARSLSLGQAGELDLARPAGPRGGGFIDYVEGVARMLEARGARLVGADLVIDGDVPLGAGLSSSAALEIATGLALLSLSGEAIDRIGLALAAQAGEHAYAGTRCGIMDQLTSVFGIADHALLIDCRSLARSPVPLRLGGAHIVLCNTQVKHELATSAYNARRAECEQGVALLGAALPGIRALRDVTATELAREAWRLPEVIARRCRHVVTENARVLEAARALEEGRLDDFGRLMFASHRSLRDDYEVSSPELDSLVEIAASVPGVFGARMTGGGFGGCTVNLVGGGALAPFTEAATRAFSARFGRDPDIFTVRAASGASEITG